MKTKILIVTLFLGILVGLTMFSGNNTPTSAATTCYAENEPCVCDTVECKCGEITLPAEYCFSDTNSQEH